MNVVVKVSLFWKTHC